MILLWGDLGEWLDPALASSTPCLWQGPMGLGESLGAEPPNLDESLPQPRFAALSLPRN